MASTTTIAAVLKRYYTGRNSGVGNIPEGGAYPTAGAQVYADLVVDSQTLAGRGNITRKMMKKAKKARNPRAAFLSYWDAEVTRIKDDLINLSCQRMVSGGAVKGVINEKKITDLSAANFVGGAGAVPAIAGGGPINWDYFGDFTPFEGCLVTNSATWVRVDVIDLNTYTAIALPGTNRQQPSSFVMLEIALPVTLRRDLAQTSRPWLQAREAVLSD